MKRLESSLGAARGRAVVLASVLLVGSDIAVSAQQNQSVELANNYEGVTMTTGDHKCSGSLVRFENSKSSDPAMVLTNGHCSGDLFDWMNNPRRHITQVSSTDSFQLMDARANIVATLQSNQIIYATINKTDIALYRMEKSFEEIQQEYGVRAMTLSSKHPKAGMPIEIVSAVRTSIYSCRVDAIIPKLRENTWEWNSAIRYKKQPGCNTTWGTSGAPIVERGTRVIVGVNNTGNVNGEKCTLSNPCEVDSKNTVTPRKRVNYGQQTADIYSCITQNNQFNLAIPGCKLPH